MLPCFKHIRSHASGGNCNALKENVHKYKTRNRELHMCIFYTNKNVIIITIKLLKYGVKSYLQTKYLITFA